MNYSEEFKKISSRNCHHLNWNKTVKANTRIRFAIMHKREALQSEEIIVIKNV